MGTFWGEWCVSTASIVVVRRDLKYAPIAVSGACGAEETIMRSLRLALCVPLLLLLVGQHQAQENATGEKSPAVPIKAKQRQLAYEIQADGSKVLKHKHEGTFYRSSSGAEMNTMDHRRSGPLLPDCSREEVSRA